MQTFRCTRFFPTLTSLVTDFLQTFVRDSSAEGCVDFARAPETATGCGASTGFGTATCPVPGKAAGGFSAAAGVCTKNGAAEAPWTAAPLAGDATGALAAEAAAPTAGGVLITTGAPGTAWELATGEPGVGVTDADPLIAVTTGESREPTGVFGNDVARATPSGGGPIRS